jgi:hypothetical protein
MIEFGDIRLPPRFWDKAHVNESRDTADQDLMRKARAMMWGHP